MRTVPGSSQPEKETLARQGIDEVESHNGFAPPHPGAQQRDRHHAGRLPGGNLCPQRRFASLQVPGAFWFRPRVPAIVTLML